ncbi:lipocalin-like domain-containing protein [Roseivirga misakiensis]|uniref:DUF306 domain-containing protein n=1 Tax=Roseivirga misakiensis TaxID=1563681 RepID=A0A1E5T575_9BACT|nr:lipocalin family protein [Roseivirga misakiensis]OEK06525.1 hypothetical protein BFP71_02315 [Roseivirga misakiensis]
MKHLKFTYLALCLTLLYSCELTDLQTPPDLMEERGLPETEEAFIAALTSGSDQKWETISFTLEGFRGLQGCRLDDTFTFYGDGTYRYDGGSSLCGDADDIRVKTGMWEVDFDNLQIIFDKDTSIEAIATLQANVENRIWLIGEVDIFGEFMDIRGVYGMVD